MKGACRAFAAGASLALAFFSPSAHSSDVLPLVWDGYYLGLNAGYSWGRSDAGIWPLPGTQINPEATAVAEEAMTGAFNSDGFVGGVTLGVNKQTGNFVVGIEGDFNAITLDGSRTKVVDGDDEGRGHDHLSGNWLATLRVRLGYAMGQSLLYVTGGGAFSDVSEHRILDWEFDPGFCPPREDGLGRCHSATGDFKAGWTIGAGFEYAISTNWSFKAEYLYTNFGREKFESESQINPDQILVHSVDLDLHTLRAGMNYRF